MGRSKASTAASLLANTTPTTCTSASGHVSISPISFPILNLIATFPPLPTGISYKALSALLLTTPAISHLLLPPPHAPIFNHLVLPPLLKALAAAPITIIIHPHITKAVVLRSDEPHPWTGHVHLLDKEVKRMRKEEEGDGAASAKPRLTWIEAT